MTTTTTTTTCKICRSYERTATNELCKVCMRRLGVIDMPPPRRRQAPCVKCNATRLIRAIPREHSVQSHHDANVPELAPMTLTHPVKTEVQGGVFSAQVVVRYPEVGKGLGMLEAYVCTSCGFVEWYCHDPEAIQIGPEYMTEVVECTGDGGPYR